ncbi:MAG: hypothetical protein A2Z27_03070 [candidate division Zixibacteria bacterium RBG_16_50_21]|nr:MAG: hypothetical protein A2Z27_03070 [candidate division Zixibacteria bacterium RBG_16_50_21]
MQATEILYDNFQTQVLDSSKWSVAAFPAGNGGFWKWEEPGAIIRTGDGKIELTVNPFTRFHHQVQIFDNPKHLILATRSFSVPKKGFLSISFKMGAATHNGNPDDFRDGFSSFNVLDFASGMVFDFIATSTKIGAIYERLLIPGLTTSPEAFTEIVEVGQNQPGKLSRCEVRYSWEEDRVLYFLEGKEVFKRCNLPARSSNLSIGFGLITLRMIENGRSSSLKGQGGTGLWSEVRTSTLQPGN